MKKQYSYIVIGVLALFIGLVLSIQIRTTAGNYQGGLVPLSKIKSYEAELKKVKDEKDEVTAELVELEARLSSIEKGKAEEDAFINGLVTDLEKYKISAGVVDVAGPGVTITIKDPPATDDLGDYSPIMYNYELLLSLVNKLKEAGAEAISINEQRIVATTEITIASNNVNINGIPTAPPYYIKAIGNPTTISDAINIRAGIVETMKVKFNLSVETEKKQEIIIPRYTGTIKYKYAKTMEKESDE
ncbi:MAG: DUF881 domain-containing protein [Eubacteriales bacterium]